MRFNTGHRLAALFCYAVASIAAAQQMFAALPAQSDSSTSKTKPGKHHNDIFLAGTVFTDKGFRLPGAQVQLRQTGQRKVRAEDVTNGVGDFSLHAPHGIAYELTVKAKGFEDQKLAIDSSSGSREDLVFRMKPATRGKK